jgi:hypothetical protein
MSFANEVDAAVASAKRFDQPLEPEQTDEIRRLAEQAVKDKGPCWWNP